MSDEFPSILPPFDDAPAAKPESAEPAPAETREAPIDAATIEGVDPADGDEPPPRPPRVQLAVAALSDMGCVRTNNEDAFGYDQELGIYVVCDGMGGMAAGEVASSRAVAAIVNSYAESASTILSVSARLLHALNVANHDVWENGQIPEHKGMGTTAVAAAIDADKLIVGNVGDSRAYILQDQQCAQLTVDHSYVNELIRNGTLTVESAQSADLHGYESVITRAIGVATIVEPDFFSVELKAGTTVLLATDGLTRYLSQDEIAGILLSSPFESACGQMIDLAKQRGGQDNITCLLLAVAPQ